MQPRQAEQALPQFEPSQLQQQVVSGLHLVPQPFQRQPIEQQYLPMAKQVGDRAHQELKSIPGLENLLMSQKHDME